MATSKGLGEFAKRTVVLSDIVARGVSRAVRTGALVLDQVAVTATPVDTGRARSNWLVSIDTPREDVPNEPSATGIPAAEATQRSLDQGRAEIGKFELGHTIFLVNNVAYIEPLDRGSSKQAPNGMTPQAIQAATAAIKKSAARLLEE